VVLKRSLVNINVLKPHEEVDEEHLRELQSQIASDGVLKKPVIVDAETMTILDGHHRVEALRRLGAEKVPAVLVQYRSPRILVRSWNGGTPPSKDEVVARASRGELFPPKTTRHVYRNGRGEVHLSELAGEVNLPLDRLGLRSSPRVRQA